MRHVLTLSAALVLSAGLGGCAMTPQQDVAKEDLLRESGFTVISGKTPEGMNLLKSLPPNKVVARPSNGQEMYFYADKLVCRCVYYGTPAQWQTFRARAMAEQVLTNEELQLIDNEAHSTGTRA